MEAFEVGDDAVVIVSLAGELDVADPGWAERIVAALDAGHTELVVDLTNVTFIDSSVVRELVLAYKRVGADGWIRLVYTHHLITRVIQICGLAETFPQFSTVESALRSAPTRASIQRSHVSTEERQRAERARSSMMSLDASVGDDHDEG